MTLIQNHLLKLSLLSFCILEVLVKNIETNEQRVAQVVVLDPPGTQVSPGFRLSAYCTMLVFPSVAFSQNGCLPLDEVAYLSPLLAFNLNLHISCLKSLVHRGEETLASYFRAKVNEDFSMEAIEASVISVGLKPVIQFPRYASHLRASFVKIPECGILESLKGSSSVEAEDRQDMIDLALQNYFEVDRYLARGDIFRIYINWKCNSMTCIPCNQKSQNNGDDSIYFKVTFLLPIYGSHMLEDCHSSASFLYDVNIGFRLWPWNLQRNKFFESIAPKLPLCLGGVFLLLFHQIY